MYLNFRLLLKGYLSRLLEGQKVGNGVKREISTEHSKQRRHKHTRPTSLGFAYKLVSVARGGCRRSMKEGTLLVSS